MLILVRIAFCLCACYFLSQADALVSTRSNVAASITANPQITYLVERHLYCTVNVSKPCITNTQKHVSTTLAHLLANIAGKDQSWSSWPVAMLKAWPWPGPCPWAIAKAMALMSRPLLRVQHQYAFADEEVIKWQYAQPSLVVSASSKIDVAMGLPSKLPEARRTEKVGGGIPRLVRIRVHGQY